MQTHILTAKDPNQANAVPSNIEVAILRTDDVALTTHPFEDNRQLIANNCIQMTKLA